MDSNSKVSETAGFQRRAGSHIPGAVAPTAARKSEYIRNSRTGSGKCFRNRIRDMWQPIWSEYTWPIGKKQLPTMLLKQEMTLALAGQLKELEAVKSRIEAGQGQISF